MRFLCTPYNVVVSVRFRLWKFSMKFISVTHRSFDISVKPGGRFTVDTLVD